jgi:hypothetical protein
MIKQQTLTSCWTAIVHLTSEVVEADYVDTFLKWTFEELVTNSEE